MKDFGKLTFEMKRALWVSTCLWCNAIWSYTFMRCASTSCV